MVRASTGFGSTTDTLDFWTVLQGEDRTAALFADEDGVGRIGNVSLIVRDVVGYLRAVELLVFLFLVLREDVLNDDFVIVTLRHGSHAGVLTRNNNQQ
jgi:hypothetical protein